MADPLDPVIRDLRAIIERARTNARLKEQQRIVAYLRKKAARIGGWNDAGPRTEHVSFGVQILEDAACEVEGKDPWLAEKAAAAEGAGIVALKVVSQAAREDAPRRDSSPDDEPAAAP